MVCLAISPRCGVQHIHLNLSAQVKQILITHEYHILGLLVKGLLLEQAICNLKLL